VNAEQLAAFVLARVEETETIARVASLGQVWTWENNEDLMSDHRGELYPWGARSRECIIATEGANPPNPTTTGAHIARHDPASTLAQCQAHRDIVTAYRSFVAASTRTLIDPATMLTAKGAAAGLLIALRALAEPYSDHPDYDPAWTIG
jgi:hypothetical protein